jgi:hypothetical protein
MELPDLAIVSQLKHIHKIIGKQNLKPDLSGFYLASDSIRSSNPEKIKVLSCQQQVLRYEKFYMAPVILSELKTNAITLFGVKAETLPVNIQPNILYDFLYGNINSYWSKWIKGHSSFLNRKIILLLFPRFTEWSVLGTARQLYTLKTGKIVSKTEAGYYCLEHLPVQYHPVIQEAINIRKDKRTYPVLKSYSIKPSFRRLFQTIDCVNYIITLFNKIYMERQQ